MTQIDQNKNKNMGSLILLAFLHLSYFVVHLLFISARETTTSSLSEMGFNSIRWVILILLGVCFLAKVLEDDARTGRKRRKDAATAPDCTEENQRNSTWFKSFARVLSNMATCAFLLWGVLTLYRFGMDQINRAAYCAMLTYPAPFLWCMKRLCSNEKEEVKSENQLKFVLHCSLIFMIANDTFCYGILGAGMTILGAATLAIAILTLTVWFCFVLTGDSMFEENPENYSAVLRIGNFLTCTAINVLILGAIVNLYLYRSDDLFQRATYCFTILSPMPFILFVKSCFCELPEQRAGIVAVAMIGSLAFICSCCVFCLSIVYNVRSDPFETFVVAQFLAFLAFLAGPFGIAFIGFIAYSIQSTADAASKSEGGMNTVQPKHEMSSDDSVSVK